MLVAEERPPSATSRRLPAALIFCSAPSIADLVGYLGADWLKIRRMENIERISRKSLERLRARQLEPDKPASLSLTLPILIAAAEESRDEL
jgi:hypothetical protein